VHTLSLSRSLSWLLLHGARQQTVQWHCMTLSRRSSGASKSIEKRRQISLVFCGSFWTCRWWLQQQAPEEAGKQLAYKCKYSLTSLFLLKLFPACLPSPKGDTNCFLSLGGHHPSQNLSTACTCILVTGSREAQSSQWCQCQQMHTNKTEDVLYTSYALRCFFSCQFALRHFQEVLRKLQYSADRQIVATVNDDTRKNVSKTTGNALI
jgi:hypothetical protein